MTDELLDATPRKRIYKSIISDYGLKTSISELIDNAIDVSLATRGGPTLRIQIDIDEDQQSISIKDNAGGVKESDLRKLISPGDSSTPGNSSTIGIFGVGSKRSVVALAQSINISSRYRKEKTFRIHYDDDWLASDSWDLPYTRTSPINASSTIIQLSNLRFRLSKDDIEDLEIHLNETYALFLIDDKIEIYVNQRPISPVKFDQWAFPIEAPPQEFTKVVKSSDGLAKIKVKITAGLTYERGSIAGNYGAFVYCNKRLIARALKSPEIGFTSGIAGVPHPKMSFARVIVELDGAAEYMPWESNKSGINYNHFLFQTIRNDIVQATKQFTRISTNLGPEYKEKIEPFKSGTIQKQRLKRDEYIRPSKLPSIPIGKPQYKSSVIEMNKSMSVKKPWTKGLYEGIIAEDLISKQKKLEQRNRIGLIVLDSTLEIAFKEYLANEQNPPIGDSKLNAILKNRIEVHNEVEKKILTGDEVWQKIHYYYKLRCDLIHKRANTTIVDSDIQIYREIVKKILRKLFGVKFPKDN